MSKSKSISTFILQLDAMLDADLSTLDRDIVAEVRRCLLDAKPIPTHLQDGMIRILANQHTPDKYGKLQGE